VTAHFFLFLFYSSLSQRGQRNCRLGEERKGKGQEEEEGCNRRKASAGSRTELLESLKRNRNKFLEC
jgi:hypothetical protein